MARLMLIDGNSLTYRAFFALPTDMATASGQVTNAVYGFTSMLINLLKDHQPDQVIATFDRPEPTFRHEMVPDYKAGRAQTPDILRQQMGLVRQLVETLHIPLVELSRLRSRRRDRHPGHPGRGPRRRRAHRHRRPRHLPAGRGSPRQGALQPAGCIRLRPLRRGRHRGPHRGHPGSLPAVRGPARRPVRQPARGARRRREDGGQADQHLRGSRRDLRPPGRAVAEAAPEPGGRRSRSCGPTPPPPRLRRDVPVEVDPTDAVLGGWDLEELRRLFDFLEFRTLWDRFLEATDHGERGGPSETRHRGPARDRPRGADGSDRRHPTPHRLDIRRRPPGGRRRVGGPRGAVGAPRSGLRPAAARRRAGRRGPLRRGGASPIPGCEPPFRT